MFRLLLATIAVLVIVAGDCPAGRIHVAPDGSDDHGDGSLGAPFASVSRATHAAAPGDTILLRGGTYNAVQQIDGASGTAAAPIVVRPHGDELPVIDGTGLDLAPNAKLFDISSWGDTLRHYAIEELEIRNSTGRGLGFRDVVGLTVRGCRVHDVAYYAIGGSGRDVVIEDNTVYHAALSNENGAFGSGGWPGVIQLHARWAEPDDPGYNDPSRNVRIADNLVHDCWGEAILISGTAGFTVSGNVIHDVWSVALYVGKSRNGVIDGNHVFMLDDTYVRPDTGLPASGLWMSNELPYEANEFPLSDVLASNNVLVGVAVGLRFWLADDNPAPDNTYGGLHFFHNVVIDPAWSAVRVDAIPAGNVPPTGCRLQNNILDGGPHAATLGDPATWVVSHNLWPDAPPDWADEPHSLQGDPGFVDPMPGGPATGYALTAASPGIDAGTDTGVAADHLGVPRGDHPDLGAFEYGVTDAPGPTDAVVGPRLDPVVPNPFNPTTVVSFTLHRATAVDLAAYDVRGRRIATLVEGRRSAGRHQVVFEAHDEPSGVYFLRLRTPGRCATGRAVLVK